MGHGETSRSPDNQAIAWSPVVMIVLNSVDRTSCCHALASSPGQWRDATRVNYHVSPYAICHHTAIPIPGQCRWRITIVGLRVLGCVSLRHNIATDGNGELTRGCCHGIITPADITRLSRLSNERLVTWRYHDVMAYIGLHCDNTLVDNSGNVLHHRSTYAVDGMASATVATVWSYAYWPPALMVVTPRYASYIDDARTASY